jgi:hypothetical protein
MHFTNTAPTEVSPAWPIHTCRGDKPLRFIILTPAYVGVRVHWFGGRSIACENSRDCLACQAGSRVDWKGYVAARSTENENVGIVSLTSTVALQLWAMKRSVTGITGLVVTLHRSPAKNTGMLYATTHGWKEQLEPFSIKTLEEMLERIFSDNAR